MARPEFLDFREWLIERLSATSHAALLLEDEAKLVQRAELLGVLPDTLREAMVLHRMKRFADGRAPPMGDKAAGSGHYQLRLWFPAELFPIWQTECVSRHMHPTVFLRSAVHDYLLSDWEPDRSANAWYYKGRRYEATRKMRCLQDSLMPRGARDALQVRAEKIGLGMTGIVRAIVCEAMEGKRLHLRPVDFAAMYDDPSRYNLKKTA